MTLNTNLEKKVNGSQIKSYVPIARYLQLNFTVSRINNNIVLFAMEIYIDLRKK